MPGLESIDLALFRFINLKLSNGVLDRIMPPLSGNAWFFPLLIVLGAALIWKGGTRGRLLVLMLALVLGLGDTLVINRIKKAVGRPRPYHAVPEAHLPVGEGSSGSLPSSHTSTWFAATLIAWIYYRRSWRVMLPFAMLIGFSRVYLGVHYPSDVLAGAILGAGYAVAGLWLAEMLWRRAGQRWFPLWWSRLPSLVNLSTGVRLPLVAAAGSPAGAGLDEAAWRERQWLHLGYLAIALCLGARLLYLAAGRIELSEDEAYQWLWSKHLALSYYSKPPMIALLHFLGTHLWGDTMFGVRFCPPIFSALLGILLLHFFARETNARAAVLLLLAANVMPLLCAGSILMTVDPPLALFWCAALCAGWRALQPEGGVADWLWTGVWVGLAFLSKYTGLLFLICLALYFVLRPEARSHLRRPGPWLALIPLGLAMLPVILWNAQHGWVTIQHVSENAKLDKAWHPTLRFFLEFTVGEAGLLHPLFFVAMLAAVFKSWPAVRAKPLSLYLLTMSAPVFFGYWLYTLHSRVQLNWIAPSVVPLLAFGMLYWEERWRAGARWVGSWLAGGLAMGAVAILFFHDTDLIRRVFKADLPASIEPLRRVRAITTLAQAVADARDELQQSDGKETFIIASHYGLTGQLTFYLPEARRGLPGAPLVYPRTTRAPRNQFYFWPEYRYRQTRPGQNAIYVTLNDKPEPPPAEITAEFESVTDLGLREIKYRGRVFHRIQLYACRHLR